MHGLVLVAIIVVRLLAYWANKQATHAGRPPAAWAMSLVRSRAIAPWVIGFGVRGVFWTWAWVIWLNQGANAWFCLCVIGAFPQLILRTLLIPAGIPHAAYYFTRVLHPQATLGETRGGAVFNELRARLRWGRALSPAALERLAGRVVTFDAKGIDLRTRAASLAARAMLDALAGDGERARELFAVVQTMHFRHAARSARVYAQAWLLSDAARRSEYHEVIQLSERGPYTVRRVFMRGAARRLLGQAQAPGRWQLGLLWLLSPGRVHSRSLLKLALQRPARSKFAATARDFATAQRLTYELLRLPRGLAARSELAELARTWQTVFDGGELHDRLRARRDALQGSFDIERVGARFEREVAAQLTALVPTTLPDGEPEAELPMLFLTALDQFQGDLLGELEELCRTLPRGDAPPTDDLLQHWRTWARVRTLAARLTDTLPARAHLIFSSIGLSTLNHGAWLYNQEKARILAHDVFRFLLGIAPKGDPNWQTIRQNAKLSQ